MNNGLPMAEDPVINRNVAYQVVNGVLASLKNQNYGKNKKIFIGNFLRKNIIIKI